MAAQLSKNGELDVRREKGRLGELRVAIDGEDVVDSSVFAYPTPGAVVKKVQLHLGGRTIP